MITGIENQQFFSIVSKIHDEFKNAKEKYPDNEYPWNNLENFNIFERVGLVATEAGEALQEANKIYFNHENSRILDLKNELIQTASTAIRVLMSME